MASASGRNGSWFVSALQAAGKDLTRERIIQVIETDGQSWPDPALAPYRFSQESHLGMTGMMVSEIEKGIGKPLTEVLVTDIGDAEITPDDSKAADDAPPESGIPEVPVAE